MYSFVDMVSRHRRTILFLTIFAAFLLVRTEGQSVSVSASSSAGLLPCSYRGTIILHGEELILDECTTCGCDNSTVKCDIKSCQPTFCEEPLSYEGECCDVCPYYVPIWEMTPQNLEVVREGVTNDLVIDLNLQINSAGQGVEGEGLWRVGMWASANDDGSGDRVGYVEQVLTEGQAATQLIRPPIFGGFEFDIPGIEYTLDATGAECPQMTRLCVEFAKGENPDPVYPQLPFTVLGVESVNDETENPSKLIGCAPFPKCEGVTVSGLSAGYSARELTAGKKDQVSIDATAQFTDTSIDLSGSGLWRLAMYGAQNEDGSGEQFQRVEQTLSSSQQSQALSGGQPITFSGAQAEIDVAGIGCNEFNYICYDFMQGESPSPSYTFRTLQDDDTKFTVCNEKECEAGITIQRTDANLRSGSVVDGRAENAYSIGYSALGQGINIEGSGLWQLTAYGSASADGSGEKLNPTTDTFTAQQAATKFVGGQTMNYGNVDFNYDMTGQTCETVQFICLELGKGPESTAYFEMSADPEDAVRSCVPAECEGVIARNFEWDYAVQGAVVPGKETPLSVKASLDTARGSRALAGEGLWRMGMFGSKNRDGSGERSGYKEQILSEANQATGMEGNGASMQIPDIQTDFDVGTIGCSDFEYICAEFTKGSEPDPDFKFEIQGRRPEEGTTFTSCKKQECLAKAIFTGLEASILGEGPIIEEMQDNPLEMDLSGIVGAGSTLIEGDNLWTMGVFASSSATGGGTKLGYQEQVLSEAMQGQSLNPPANLDFSQVPVNFDMRGISCEDARYLCAKLSKNEAATPNYEFKADPSERVLTRCIDIQDRCEGVTVTTLDWDREVGTISYGMPADVNLNVNVGTSDTSRDVEGQGLWRLGMYGSRNEEGTGEKRAYVSQVLDPFSASQSLEGGMDLAFNDLEAPFRMDELGCSEFKFLCLEFTKGYGADPDFKFKVEGGGDRIVKCKPEECRGVFVTSTESSPDSVMLYEGNPSNYITYDSNAQTTEASGPVVGLNMWNMAMYGSERPNGEGPQHGRQEQTLSPYHSSIPLREPGQMLEFSDVATNFDMTGLTCKQVKHLCTELSRSDGSSVDFELTGVPDETVLKSCFPVPKDGCKGVVITDMDWDMEVGEVRSNRPDALTFEVDVDSLPGSGSVDGSGLWRLGLYGSTNPQGSGAKKLGLQRNILNMDEAGKALRAGETMTFPYVEAEFDLTQIGCEEEFQYLCLELAKGQRANPDFMFEVQNGGDEIVRCKRQECRKGVRLNGLDVQNMAQGQSLLEGSRTNRLLFDMEGLATRDSGGASGDGLWDMSVWASADEECMGPRMNEQTRNTLSRYQQNKDVRPGENVNFGPVDMNFDMTGLTCNDVRYMCVELKKGSRPEPDFEFTPVPNSDVMKKSFRHKCEGVIIDGTRMDLGGRGEIPVDGDQIEFDVTVNANPNGADVRGSNLWNMEAFLANDPQGKGSRNTLERQVLTSADASRDLMAGGKLRFPNLAARVSQDDINCEEGTYICVELSQGQAAQPQFTMQPREGAGDAPYIDCEKLKCAKPPPTAAPGPKGSKGEPGELPRWEDFPPGERGPSGRAGPMGNRGPTGYKGPPGPRGGKGPDGRDGKNGLPGRVGAPGRAGPPGEVVMAPQRSKGPAFRPQPVLQLGPPGAPGHPGPSGAPGLYGMRGPPGDSGRPGPPGPPGGPGSRGSPGEDGNNGRNGNRGAPGPSGQNGARGPSGRPGRGGAAGHKGFRGLRGVTGARGDRGIQGESGSRGRAGAAGAVGVRGPAGIVGESGNRGSRGPSGERGATGPTGEIGGAGPQGSQGPVGRTGFGGAKGDAGPTGDMGETGIQGEPGENGARGAAGAAGQTGIAGQPGTAGGLGDAGPVGAPGAQGLPGRRGPAGITGPGGARGGGGDQGMQGRPGQTGQQGIQGERGEYGAAGPRGSRGRTGERGEDGLAGPAGARGAAGERGPGGLGGRPGGSGAAGIRGNTGEAGPSGPAGATGDDGEPGRAGTPGRPGDRGPEGPSGTPGNDGKPGPPGSSGNEGRPGPPGPTGLLGAPGNSGPPGPTGAAGADGSRGRPGNAGPRGPAGEEGKEGNAGQQGAAGAPGARGDSGPQGAGGPPGSIGPLGRQGLTGARGARGGKGPSGSAGGPGLPGPDGETGPAGAIGLRGPAGEDGPEGSDGREGGRGDDGVKGPVGDAGARGIPGLPGQPGTVGPGGATGGAGERGEQGAPGAEGEDGRPGERGPSGAMGPSGQQGPRGPSADAGPPGRNGVPGPNGERGEAGAAGNAGQSGPPGGPGPTGPVGPVGEKGPRGGPGDQGPEGGVGRLGRTGAPGPVGARGSRGEAGSQGAVGPQGAPGPGGPRGAVGERGGIGATGVSGPSGNMGRPGARGPSGTQGPSGNRGAVGPPGKTGTRGEGGRDGDTGAVGPAGLAGPSGPAGLLGPGGRMGASGPTGLAGRAGSDGSAGPKGPTGSDGPDGQPGAQGPAGSRGITGSDGSDGVPGAVGPQGARGPEGEDGPIGPTGSTGMAGLQGPQGPQGAVGFRGSRGRTGARGPSGPDGPDGPTGPTGPVGATGARGETGSQGMAGDKGHDGIPGGSGRAGKKGANGRPGERGGNGMIGPVGPDGDNGSPGGAGQRGPRGFAGPGGQRGSRGGAGPEGMPGPPGRPGPPGPTEMGGYYSGPAAQAPKGPDIYSYTYRDMANPEPLEDGRLRATFTALHYELIKMLAPQGTIDNPARTCSDIFRLYPQKESGPYWIDPNEGSPDDKFEVYCDKKTNETCVNATRSETPQARWWSNDGDEAKAHRLFSDMTDGFEFTYQINTIQLTFLRLLTNQARQTVTYKCKNSVGAYDAENHNMDLALRLITTTDAELTADGKSTFRYNIVKDGCQRHTGNWEKTVLEYKTKKNTRLPIVDVAPADIGEANQEFALVMGPVCFS